MIVKTHYTRLTMLSWFSDQVENLDVEFDLRFVTVVYK